MVKELIDTYYKSHDFTKQAHHFIEDPSKIGELVDIALSDLPKPYPEHASWLMVHICGTEPTLLSAHQVSIIDRILTSENQSVLRNLVNVCHSLPLIEYRETELLDRLISLISNDDNKVALFVYACYKLTQFVQKYPELKPEIEAIFSLKQEPLKPAMRIGIRNFRAATNNS